MSEAVEVRIEDMKTLLGLCVGLLMVGLGVVLAVLADISGEPFLHTYVFAFMVGGALFVVGSWGRHDDGYCRRLVSKVPGCGYSDPPISEWKEDLKESGELYNQGEKV